MEGKSEASSSGNSSSDRLRGPEELEPGIGGKGTGGEGVGGEGAGGEGAGGEGTGEEGPDGQGREEVGTGGEEAG